jgi:hypothetical protein
LVDAPTDRRLLTMAARGCTEFAFAFLEDDVEGLTLRGAPVGERRAARARAVDMYDRAFSYAMRLLATFDATAPAAYARGGAAWDAVLARLPTTSLPGLTFGGMALASAVNLSPMDPARLATLPRARAMLVRSQALDPRFYDGAAAMVLGLMAARLGDRDEAERWFRSAIAASDGKFLMPRVMMAKALYGEHRAAMRKALEDVLAEPRDVLPRARLANEVARRRAARYLRVE